MREVTTDRRSLNDVASIVKKSNNKLAELKSELHELESQILITKGNSVSNGQGKQNSTAKTNKTIKIEVKNFQSVDCGTKSCNNRVWLKLQAYATIEVKISTSLCVCVQ